MGSIRKRKNRYEAQIRRRGLHSLTKTFNNKTDATVWVRGIEARIDAGDLNVLAPKLTTLGDLLTRYQNEITPLKKGHAAEARRINRLLHDSISSFSLRDLNGVILAQFRDRRINDGVRAAQYDLIIIRHAIKIARLEWGVSMPNNPVDDIRIPNGIRKRDRRLREHEYERLRLAAQSCKNPLIWPLTQFAIATAMRRSEILSLRWDDIDLQEQIATLAQTKNGSKREVPLTKLALEILKGLSQETDYVFAISENAFRLSWSRLIRRSGIKDLRFHDLRHEAVSRFFEMGLSVPEVGLISGHRDLRMLSSYIHLNSRAVVKKIEILI
tara:strand:+ start:130 stop:1110 length:981 start_codon:yes stop_codon:yes gene_type:complete